jgi:hypothetical protein
MKMNKAILVSGVAALTALSAFAFFDWRRVTVESGNGGRTYRRVSIDGRVRLVKQLSSAPCVQGRSWGYDSGGIWVDNGCRAEFEYEQDTGRGNTGGVLDRIFRTRGRTETVRVESRGDRRVYKRIDTSGGVRLIRTLSDTPCTQGRTWGYDRNGIWVDRGCRGEFEVGSNRGNTRDVESERGVPHWTIGDWRSIRGGMDLTISSGGSVTLRGLRNVTDIQRGSIHGNMINMDRGTDYRVNNRGGRTMILVPENKGYAVLTFEKRD